VNLSGAPADFAACSSRAAPPADDGCAIAVGIGITTTFLLPAQNSVVPSGSIARRPMRSQKQAEQLSSTAWSGTVAPACLATRFVTPAYNCAATAALSMLDHTSAMRRSRNS
jgi:hypothetical protein